MIDSLRNYVQATVDQGFRLAALSECEPSEAMLADLPDELDRRRRVPLMLLIGAAQIPRSRISSS